MLKKSLGIGLHTLASIAVMTGSAAAQFPDRPISLIVPYAPGGNTDQVGRMLASSMSKELGQQVVVQNRPGANASLGSTAVARAEPDGYTLLVGNTSVVLNPLLYKSLPYGPKDLEPIAIAVQFPLVLVVNNDIPPNSVSEFVAYAKKEGGKLNFASAGSGNSTHLASELFKREAGVDMTHVPYNGSAQGLTAVIAGDVQSFFDTTVTTIPFISSNRLKALAVASDQRVPALPDVPTMAESGYPDYGAVTAWQGIFVPANTPSAVKARLRAAVNAALADPNNRAWVEGQGGVLLAADETGERAATYLQHEQSRWGGLVKSLNIELD